MDQSMGARVLFGYYEEEESHAQAGGKKGAD
jgi:hypothetical protein